MPETQQQHSAATVLLLTASYDRTIRFWEPLSGICSRTIQHPDSQVNRLTISTDKRLIAAAGNPHIRIYEALTNNGNPISTFEGHTTNVTAVQFQQNAQWIVSGSEDGTVKVWDMRTSGSGKASVQREYSHEKNAVSDVVIHPNQVEIISSDMAGSIRIWDLRAGQNNTTGATASTNQTSACTHELVPEEDAMIKSVSVASDSSIITAGTHKGNVYVWKVVQNSSMTMVQKETSNLTDLVPVTKFKAHNNYMLKSVLSPDVKHIATASADSTIKLWSIDQSQDKTSVTLSKTLTGHTRWVWDCAFSADSEYIVSAASDHTARLWDLNSGESIRTYQGHHKAAVCVCLNDYSF